MNHMNIAKPGARITDAETGTFKENLLSKIEDIYSLYKNYIRDFLFWINNQ